MSTISQPTPTIAKPRRLPADRLLRNMWAGLAIVVMWLAVLFAWLATKAVAKHGLSRADDPGCAPR
jgi:hypothetical protein